MEPKENILKSSLLSSYSFDDSTLDLSVTFSDGSSWLYRKVEPSVVSKVFDSPGSIGSKFIRLIKHGRYQASKLD